MWASNVCLDKTEISIRMFVNASTHAPVLRVQFGFISRCLFVCDHLSACAFDGMNTLIERRGSTLVAYDVNGGGVLVITMLRIMLTSVTLMLYC